MIEVTIVTGAVQMSLSDRMRRSIFVSILVHSIAAFAGCGGSEPAAPGNESPVADETTASPPATSPQTTNAEAAAVIEPERDGKEKRTANPDEDENDTVSNAAPANAAPAVKPAFTIGRLGHSKDDEESGTQAPVPVPVAGSQAAPQLTAPTPRPDNVEVWTNADFLSAAREHDPKILEAIDFKVKSAPGDASVAVLLTHLLDPSSPSAATHSDGTTPQDVPPETPADPGASPPPETGPQSSLRTTIDLNLNPAIFEYSVAVDSVSAMFLESIVTYMPQGAAVGAIAGGVQNRIAGNSGKDQDRIADDESGLPRPAKSGRKGKDEEEEGTTGAGLPTNTAGRGAPGGNAAPVAGQLQDRELVERVVDGLITNNSQDAWQSIYGIVAGTVQTPLSAELNCEIVIERLIRNMESMPDVIQPVMLTFLDSATPIPPERRRACMRMLSAISAAHIDRLTGFTDKEQAADQAPGNVSALAGAALASGAMGRGLGRSRDREDDEQGFTAPPVKKPDSGAAAQTLSTLPVLSLEPQAVARGAEFLRSTKVAAAIASQLENVTDLSSASDLILLASTIPVTKVRHAIFTTFLRLHESGSDGLSGSGLFNEVHDPALLVILKSLPRTRPLKDAPGVMDSWTSGTETLVLALLDELRRTSGSLKPNVDTLPLKLHKNATADLSAVLEIPAVPDQENSEAVPASTVVYYTRTNFTPQRPRDIDDLTNHYEGRTGGFSRPDPDKGVMWIEGVKVLPDGHRRTFDVVIQKAGTGGGAGGSFSVEIIVVDTIDPKNANPAGTTQASAEQ